MEAVMSDVIPINERARQRMAAREARRAATEKNGNVLPISPPLTISPTAPRLSLARVALIASGLALGAVGLAINAEFARSLGATEWAGWLFLAVGVASDVAAFVLPTLCVGLWRQHRWRAVAGAGLWSVTFGFALIASVGFASLNITDAGIERAGRSTPAIEDARLALADAKAARDRECIRVRRPMCQRREDEVLARQDALAAERRAVVADPQTEGAARLVAWATGVRPAPEALAGLRLALLTLLPQIGGLLLAVARR
jgi:hypothetical protein